MPTIGVSCCAENRRDRRSCRGRDELRGDGRGGDHADTDRIHLLEGRRHESRYGVGPRRHVRPRIQACKARCDSRGRCGRLRSAAARSRPVEAVVPRVVFRPAAGAVVKLELLDFGQAQRDVVGPEHVTVRGMAIRYIRAWAGSRDSCLAEHQRRTLRRVRRDGRPHPWRRLWPLSGAARRFFVRVAHRWSRRARHSGRRGVHGATSSHLVNHHVDGMFIWGGREHRHPQLEVLGQYGH